MLKNPDKVREIVSAVVECVPIPVTVKIRSGWDHNSINAVEIAKICEEAGARLGSRFHKADSSGRGTAQESGRRRIH